MQREKGFSLIELLIAIALVGILGVSVPGALSMANRSTILTNQETLAESLARNQMDYIQNQPYDTVNNPPVYSLISNIPNGDTIVTPMASRLAPKGLGTGTDEGIQQITITIKQGTKTIYTLIDYKVNR